MGTIVIVYMKSILNLQRELHKTSKTIKKKDLTSIVSWYQKIPRKLKACVWWIQNYKANIKDLKSLVITR